MGKMFKTGLAVLLLLFVPASATASGRTPDEDSFSIWDDYADNRYYELLDYDIDLVFDDFVQVYTFTLNRGDYLIVAEGDRNIVDLDLAAWELDEYEDGDDPFIKDILTNNTPELPFSVTGRGFATIVVVVSVYDFYRHEDDGYFCIMVMEQD